jgi:peptidyl-prolyl cis-trans isomerase B (cyclophilin B)
MRALIASAVALALLLGACGSGDAGDTADEALPLDEITAATPSLEDTAPEPPPTSEAADTTPTTAGSTAVGDEPDGQAQLGAAGGEGLFALGDEDGAVVRIAEPAAGVAVTGDAMPFFDPNTADAGVGRDAPAFSGPDLTGGRIDVTPGDGPLVVLFLAHWCPHCQEEVPALLDYFAENPVPDGVELVTVATSNSADRSNHPASDWLEREGWDIPTIIDDDATSIAAAYGLSAFPFYAFVDGNGVMAGRVAGAQSVDNIGAVLTSLADGYLVPDSARPGAALADFRAQPTACGGDQPSAPAEMAFAEPGSVDLDGPAPQLVLSTSCGELSIRLDSDAAPETVASMVFLSEQGYFDGTVCHRYVRGFVLQCGDPTASGSGGPGYVLPDEFPPDGFDYARGVVAMANAGPGSTGSQFFIVTGEETGLPSQFTVIGTVEVTDGFLAALDGVPLGVNDFGETSSPLETIYIERATVGR